MTLSPNKTLSIRFMGCFEINYQGETISSIGYTKVNMLFAYLCCHQQQLLSRENLCSMFWPNKAITSARNNLRQVFAVIRKQIKQHFREVISLETTSKDVTLTLPTDGWLDLSYLESKEAKHCSLKEIEEMLHLFQGEALPFFETDGLDEIEDWLIEKRLHIEKKYQSFALRLLSLYKEQKNYERLLSFGLSLSEQFPWNEDIHFAIIEAYAQTNQPSSALFHYKHLRKKLQRELKAEPRNDLQELIASLQKKPANIEPQRKGTQESLKTALFDNRFPFFSTPFVSRKEVDKLWKQLLSSENRLFSLLGISGIGKTRCACHLGQQAFQHFQQGAIYIDFAQFQPTQTKSKSYFYSFLAEQVHFPLSPSESIEKQFLSLWRTEQYLLILDHADFAKDYIDCISSWLQASPLSKMLLVSREEILLGGVSHTLDTLSREHDISFFESDAARYFFSLILDKNPTFPRRKLQSTIFKHMIDELSGHPVLLEQVSLWLAFQTPETLLQNLQQGGLKTEEQTLEQQWQVIYSKSWERLFQEQKQVLFHLAILQDSFSQETATSFAETTEYVLYTLLQQKWLYTSSETNQLSIQKLTKKFIQEQGEFDIYTYQEKKRCFFLREIWKDRPTQQSLSSPWFLKKTDQHWKNIKDAYLSALQCKSWDLIDESIEIIDEYCLYSGKYIELQELLSHTKAVLTKHHLQEQSIFDKTCSLFLRCMAINGTLEKEHIDEFQFLGSKTDHIRYRFQLVKVTFELRRSSLYVREGLKEQIHSLMQAPQQAGEQEWVAWFLVRLGSIEYRKGNFREAEELQTKAHEIFLSLQSCRGLLTTTQSLIISTLGLFDLEKAEALLEVLHHYSTQLPHQEPSPYSYLYRAMSHGFKENWFEAEQELKAFIQHFNPYQTFHKAYQFSHMAHILDHQGRFEEALPLHLDRYNYFRLRKQQVLLPNTFIHLQKHYRLQERLEENPLLFWQATAMIRSRSTQVELYYLLFEFAETLLVQGHLSLVFQIVQTIFSQEDYVVYSEYPASHKNARALLKECYEQIPSEETSKLQEEDLTIDDLLHRIMMLSIPTTKVCHCEDYQQDTIPSLGWHEGKVL